MNQEYIIRKNNKGFTLVELIVVLVILAILAAILVPALLGYIDEAKNKQYVLEAKNILTSAQSELSSVYAKSFGAVNNTNNIFGVNEGTENWIDAKRFGFSRNIFKRAGYGVTGVDKPWNEAVMVNGKPWNTNRPDDGSTVTNELVSKDKNFQTIAIGVGKFSKYANPSSSDYDPHKAYTVYCMIYFPRKNADVIFFDGTNYSTKEWPFSTPVNAEGTYNLNGIEIQFIYIHVGGSNNWDMPSARNELNTLLSQ